MDAQTLIPALGVGAFAGFAHVTTLRFGLNLMTRGRVFAGAAFNLLRLAGVAAALLFVARLGPAALQTAAAALILARALAIRLQRGAP
jgi:hypothetical protein